MQPTHQFEVPVPLAVVKARLEAARRPMAPRINDCVTGDDQTSFTSFITYSSAGAVLKAKASGNGTKILVEVRSLTIWTRPIGMLITMAILLIGTLASSAIFHAKTFTDWCVFPGSLLVWIGVTVALIPLSKRVLVQFISDTVLDKGSSSQATS